MGDAPLASTHTCYFTPEEFQYWCTYIPQINIQKTQALKEDIERNRSTQRVVNTFFRGW